jgi:hypothetical protein
MKSHLIKIIELIKESVELSNSGLAEFKSDNAG